MSAAHGVRSLLGTLAAHPVLPPADALPVTDEALHGLLADLAQGERSTHAATLREVAAERAVPLEELARRAQFLLACLVLPGAGTHYEVLGVAPGASPAEIRKRWASLIQRYHPDHLGSGGSWLESQARRLIEAYQTLKDPERRRQYDVELARVRSGVLPHLVPARRRWAPRFAGPARWRWAPLGILSLGIAAGVWAYTRPVPAPLPLGPLAQAPQLLGTSGRDEPNAGSGYVPSPADPRSVPSVTAERVAVEPGQPAPLSSSLHSNQTPVAAGQRAPAAPAVVPPATPPLATASAPATAPTHGATPVPPAPGTLPPQTAVAPPTQDEATLAPSVSPPLAGAPATKLPRSSELGPAPAPAPAGPPVVAARPEPAPSPSTQPGEARIQPAPREDALALIEAFRSAYERKDLRALMALLGSEPRERDVPGRQAVETLYRRQFAALDHIRYELTELDVTSASAPEAVVVHGRFRIRATHRGGPSRVLDVTGPIRWLVQREGGALRVIGIDYDVPRR